ncbi:uncharacterized protein RCC_03390 [Ramularia collo-cygni]|uniref:Uncharacterized protein n=1 Tax=Ramularia collo-cygni TaxID=112498 RepID=A0A2D3V204_9PEZI|nr:uncharacterized protein RCC_03390 [Ramularia collo-cygni]CZT17556.1 uncharacterized protein RCC_03390 [Ramularia collo-cygni]
MQFTSFLIAAGLVAAVAASPAANAHALAAERLANHPHAEYLAMEKRVAQNNGAPKKDLSFACGLCLAGCSEELCDCCTTTGVCYERGECQ